MRKLAQRSLICSLQAGDPEKLVIQGLRTMGAGGVNTSLRAGEGIQVLRYSGWKQKGQIPPPSIFLFCTGPSWDWMIPTHVGEGNLLFYSTNSNANSRNTFTGTPSNNI